MTRDQAIAILLDAARCLYGMARNGFITLADGTEIEANPVLEAIETVEETDT